MWQAAHEWGRDGWSGRLRLEAVEGHAARHGYHRDDVDRALALERYLWPKLKPPDDGNGDDDGD